ncbi:hypothetical protein BGX33_010986 [Mortierella sp. NVP41]|nr:hypothetical protein BGX33_010986 [Mortierella sp. NVP41]
MPDLPIEIWFLICDQLYPSQLWTLGQTSRSLRTTTQSHTTWSRIFQENFLEVPVPPPQTTAAHAANFRRSVAKDISRIICDHCLGLGERSEPTWSLKFTMRNTLSTQNPAVDKNFNARLCMPCRGIYYFIFPQPVPASVAPFTVNRPGSDDYTVTRFVTANEAEAMYLGYYQPLDTLPHRICRPLIGRGHNINLADEQDVLVAARGWWGGDVGIEHNRIIRQERHEPAAWPLEDDAMRRRRDLMRSLLTDRGYYAQPDHKRIRAFVKENQGDPFALVQELCDAADQAGYVGHGQGRLRALENRIEHTIAGSGMGLQDRAWGYRTGTGSA